MVLLNLSQQFYWEKKQARIQCIVILGDPRAASRVDKMFVVKVYCKIETTLDLTANFHHEHFIDPTNSP